MFGTDLRSIEIEFKKKISTPHIFGLTIFKNYLYASANSKNCLLKIDLSNLTVKEYLSDFKIGWQKKCNNESIDLKSIHSVDFDNNGNYYLTFYHTNKVIKYNIKKKKLKKFNKKKLNGPSHSFLSENKKKLLVSEYHGNISFFKNNGDFLYDLKKILIKNNIKKPHMVKEYKKKYFIVATDKKKIVVLNSSFDTEKVINNLNLNNNSKISGSVKFQTPVAISFDQNSNVYITDVYSGIIILDKEYNLIGLIDKNYVKIKKKKFKNLPFEIKQPYDTVVHQNQIIIANTHAKNVVILKKSNF